ncbi:MAG: hypothetical protein K5931_06385 [Lachnospiraceae bacterium]|nr:hypothetical protein [Lachnospiraceae bacterium]
MIKSKALSFVTNGEDFGDILEEAEKFATEAGLSPKGTRRLRLITEDTLCMLKTITGEVSSKLSFIGGDNEVVLHVETETFMNIQKREELLAISKSGKNESVKGVMGKIREAFELAFLMPSADVSQAWVSAASPAMLMGMPGDIGASDFMNTMCWSLSNYKDSIDTDIEEDSDKAVAWDELEKSIVASIAEDVRIGIRGDYVVIDVIMKTN